MNPWSDDNHMALIQTAKQKINSERKNRNKVWCYMGVGHSEKYLTPFSKWILGRGFVNGKPLGAGQLMNEELCLHHENVLADRQWLPIYKAYAMAVKLCDGILIIIGNGCRCTKSMQWQSNTASSSLL